MSEEIKQPEPQQTAETRTGLAAGANADLPALERGARLSRYTILARIGRGGMGSVYAAYDPKLDRRVALKVLRADLDASGGKEAHTRLLREAQAMARLSHPNVIAVYDVGLVDKEVFVAMEYVPGRNLARWLREKKPSWPEVIDLLVQAGRGLAAAHASGLIHRDFKPANVIVGEDGRVRVLDFGLARSAERIDDPDSVQLSRSGDDLVEDATPLPELTPEHDPLGTPVTAIGMVVGTPYYMSPEQYRNRADERSDQYSFCVALYEGLYGVRPFDTEDHAVLRPLVLAGQVRPPPRDTKVPSRYLDIIRRGMSLKPEDRFPSMTALLAALTRSRRRVWRSIAIALVAAGIAAGFAINYLSGQPHVACAPATAKLTRVWDEARKQEIHRAFSATGLPYADAAWLTVADTLDRYSAQWLQMHQDTCLATEVRHEQSARLLDLRMLCLDQRLGELRALSDLFATADADVVERAVLASAEMPAIDQCADLRALTERLEPPADPAARARIAEVRAQLAEASALRSAGKFTAGLELVRTAVASARDIGFAPLEAAALEIQGTIELHAGDARAAAATLIDAEIAALAARDDHSAAAATSQLVAAVGYLLGRHDEAEIWARTAKALLARGEPDPAVEANLEINLVMLRSGQGKYEEAEEHARRVLALRQQAMGENHPLVARAYHTLGVVLKKRGEYRPALDAYQRALAILRPALGEDHPDVAMTLHNIGVVERRMGKDRLAVDDLRHALEIWRRTLPADHPNIGMALLNLGGAESALGDNQAAQRDLEQARAIKASRLGEDHWSTAKADLALASVLYLQGKDRAAVAIQRSALKRLIAALGDDHPEVAIALGDLAVTQFELGDYAAAGEAYRRALALLLPSLADDHPDVADLRVGIARVALAQNHPRDAIEPLEQAVASYQSHHSRPTKLAAARFLLARAVDVDPMRREEAEVQAGLALTGYRNAGGSAKEIAEIEQWLAGRPGAHYPPSDAP